jgi:hypothetical protein
MADPSRQPKKRNRFQFTLRGLLVVTVILACVLGWVRHKLNRVAVHRAAARRIEEAGGRVHYFYPGKRFDPGFFPLVTVVAFGPGATDKDLELVRPLDELVALRLDRSSVTDEGLRTVAELENLESLSLSSTYVTDAGLRHLERLKRLESLGLAHTAVTDHGLKTLARLPNLRWVGLHDTHTSLEAISRWHPVLSTDMAWSPAPSEAHRRAAAALERRNARVSGFTMSGRASPATWR